MGIESFTDYAPDELNELWPLDGDDVADGNEHINNVKKVFKTTLPNITGPITPTQARLNSLDDNGNRNYIINGAFDIWQRGTSFTDLGGGSFFADRWAHRGTRSGANTVDFAKETTEVPSTNSTAVKITANGGATAVAGTNVSVSYKIEGYDAKLLGFGAAGASITTLSFEFKTSVTGTYCATISNDVDRYNIQEFVVSDTNWNSYNITFTGDTTGTWGVSNDIGVTVGLTLSAGSTFQGSAGWNGSKVYGTSNQVDFCDTAGAICYLSNVKYEKGSAATDFTTAGASIAEELAMCQRYYCKSYTQGVIPGAVTGIGGMFFRNWLARAASGMPVQINFPTTMRTVPTTLTIYALNGLTGSVSDCNTGYTHIGSKAVSSVSKVNDAGFSNITLSATAETEDIMGLHYTAEAEL